ncbi:Krr1-domain-containing protein [Trametes versicolor FP-101664 SS1]|uniref:Krr1-domain-containing protein n=1 Tax=Trametes versicolor (strain FP-101664) TaxID=717944 RepID=UPI0004621B69|nr:Krr1-domain-containing protein [Trametes versicolor FP-101664 SS1]EIW53933.1 Krr1-domain-containing protein [Trametes versicolor FP-101664 SS1]
MLSDDSDVEEIHTLTVNEHFAKAFEYRKEREELAKLKEKYGSDLDENDEDEEDSEEAESEDEDGEELTPAVDAAILRTLARIKRKDPAIYQNGKDIFEEEKEKTGDVRFSRRSAKDKSKPLTMRQHALASALDGGASRSASPEPLTHVEEQKELRSKTIAAFHTAVDAKDESEEEEDDFLVPREKTKDEIEREEEEYRAFLEREVGEDLSELVTVETDAAGVWDGTGADSDGDRSQKKSKKGKKKDKKPLNGKQDEDQEFLLNYILNRGWIDKSARRMPTYKEITGSKKGKGRSDADSDSEGSDDNDEGEEVKHQPLDEDDFDEVADRFESSYNFRFEEPGAAQITRYPRTLPELVRRQDTARKEAREKRKARKEEELLKKKEEVKRLKALKLKELRAKLERIGHEGGKVLAETEALQELDLEGEWDPAKHDEQMAKIYADDEVYDDEDELVDEKPQWDDDIDIGEIIVPEDDNDGDGASKKKKKKKKKKKGEDDMDEGGVDIADMDADVERAPGDEEEWDGTEEMRKKKLDEYMDEIYGLDFNDVVAGMPTRFKYAKVESQTFGLSPAEILMATDAELNTYMGVKKIAPYRKEGKGRNWDSKRTARLQELKAKLKERGIGGSVQAGVVAQEKKKRKGKKERMREKAVGGEEEEGDVPEPSVRKRKSEERDEPEEGDEGSAKKRRRRHKKSTAAVSA